MANDKLRAILERIRARNETNSASAIAAESPYTKTINKFISSIKELRYYVRLMLKEMTVTRKSLGQPKIDLTLVDDAGQSNYERMMDGRGPVLESGSGDGTQLHHMKQKFHAPFAELTGQQHLSHGVTRILHPKGQRGESWRNEEGKEAEFDEERMSYWIKRVKQLGRK